jgi:hypothetical protein
MGFKVWNFGILEFLIGNCRMHHITGNRNTVKEFTWGGGKFAVDMGVR